MMKYFILFSAVILGKEFFPLSYEMVIIFAVAIMFINLKKTLNLMAFFESSRQNLVENFEIATKKNYLALLNNPANNLESFNNNLAYNNFVSSVNSFDQNIIQLHPELFIINLINNESMELTNTIKNYE